MTHGRGSTLVLTTALLLFIGIVPSALARHTDEHEWEGIPTQMRDAGLARAERHGMFARMQADAGGNVSGRFVSFHYAQDIGTIHDFTVKYGNTTGVFFSAITPSPFVQDGRGPFVAGAQFGDPNSGLTVRSHNNPTVLTGWHGHANGTTLTFQLASGATTFQKSPDGKQVRINQGALHGHILTNGNRTVDNTTNTVTVMLDRGDVALFMAHPPLGPGAQVLHFVNGLFAARRLGAIMNLADGGGQAIVDKFEAEVGVNVTRIGPRSVTITANANVSGPRILIFIVDPETLDGDRADRIRARLNNVLVNTTNSEADVDGGTDARVHVLRGHKMAMIIIKIPRFSTQTITLEQDSEEASPPPGETTGRTRAPGLEIAGLALTLSVAVLLAARRRRA